MEIMVLRYSVSVVAPGCMALVLESLTSRPPYILENRTPHPLFFRQAAAASLPYQELPPYAAAGFCWRQASSSPQKVRAGISTCPFPGFACNTISVLQKGDALLSVT